MTIALGMTIAGERQRHHSYVAHVRLAPCYHDSFSMLFCFFIARRQPELEPLAPGLVRHADLVAATRLLPDNARLTPDLMLEYNAVLRTAWERATVLPVRFGDVFSGEEALLQLLASRRGELLEALDRLKGKAEMGLRVAIPAGVGASDRVAEITLACRPLDCWFEVQWNRAGEAVLELAHLIDRQEAGEYRRRAEPLQIEVSGPRPPVHFLPQFLRRPVETERGVQRPRRRAAAAG